MTSGCGHTAHIPSPQTRQAPASPVYLENIAASKGIRFVHQHGAHGPLTIVETMGSGCAIFDYNGDGRPDIFLVSSGPDFKHPDQPSGCRLYRNDGARGFTDVTRQSGLVINGYAMGCCAGDYDNDGHTDLFVTGYGRNWLFHNQGDGTFKDVSQRAGILRRPGAWGTGCGFVDVNRDGWLDLYVCNYVRYNPAIPLCPSGKIMTGCTPSYYKTQPNELYLNNHHGGFIEQAAKAGAADPQGASLGMVTADFDNDGWPDLFIANDGTPNALLQNSGRPSPGSLPDRVSVPHFRDIAQEAGVAYGVDGGMRAGMGVDAGDLSGKGRMDLVVTNFQHEPSSIFRNDGSGRFTDVSVSSGVGAAGLLRLKFGVAILDVDGDGLEDIYVGDGHVFDNVSRFDDTATYRQLDQLFLNTGQGHFKDISASSGPALQQPSVSRGVAVGDLDSDGVPYILINDSGLPARLLRIHRRHSASWIGFVLQGVKSNRSGIGARVTLEWPGGVQVREVRSGESYLSQSDLRPLFGLGACRDPDRVHAVVHWPSGIVQSVPVTGVDRYISVLEAAPSRERSRT